MRMCSVCGRSITGSYFTNYWGEAYCSTHYKVLPHCSSCHRTISMLSTGGGIQYRDGRLSCNVCRKSAVRDSATAEYWTAQVLQFMANNGLDLRGASIPVRLTDQDELVRRSSHSYAAKPLALACSKSITGPGNKRVIVMEEILVQNGLPAEQFAGVIAHELGHAWFVISGYHGIPPLVEEGFCELCALVWLRNRNRPEAHYQIRLMAVSPNPVYGAGFSLARRVLPGRSLKEVGTFVGTRKAFPPPIPPRQIVASWHGRS